MESQLIGRALMIFGAIAFAVGVFFVFKERIPGLDRLGRLPGDISIERENVRIYFPLTTSILVSAFLSFVFWLFRSRG